MNPLLARFLDAGHAFDHPVTRVLTIVVAAALALAGALIAALGASGKITPELRKELRLRYLSWLVLAPMMLVPVLLGPGWTILAVGALSLACYREYARATGLFREKMMSLIVVIGILLVTFASLDHWYALFMALNPLVCGLIASAAILQDQPKGYIQRVALGIFAFILLGTSFGHLGYLANDRNYRPILFLIVLCVELNDIFAFCVGKTLGRRKLAPNTSPNKTVGGSLGALVITTALVATISHFIFKGTVLGNPVHGVALGLLVSVLGQLGDLLLSSIKRDIGIKDMGATIPGHGGILDRFNSLLLVSPAVFYYIGYFLGIGLDQPAKIITGG